LADLLGIKFTPSSMPWTVANLTARKLCRRLRATAPCKRLPA